MMAEFEPPPGDPEGSKVEAYTYSAGSYDRLKTNEEELFELVRLSEVPIDKQLFKVILELLKLNVAPAAILQVLKSLRPQNTPDDFESRSPVPQRSADSKHHQQQQPLPSSSSETLPGAPLVSGASLNGGRGTVREKRTGQSDWSEKGKEGHHKVKKSSSDRHQSKHRGKGHRHHEGSAKHKTQEPP